MQRATVNDLLIGKTAEEHEIETPFGSLTVWIRELSWIDRQEALGKFVSLTTGDDGEMTPQIDFGGYWRFMLKRCVIKTEPALSNNDLLNLKGEVGNAIQALLPSFDSLTEGMGEGGMTGPLE